MGFVLIRHFPVELRRVNMDRVPMILCVLETLVRENLCLWSVSNAAKNETWHVDDNWSRTHKCEILSLPAL